MTPFIPGDALAGTETPAFLAVGGEQLAVMHHATATPKATVVLAGPMSLERSHGALTWVRWARTLAVNGYETWRFDYRGVGESTGAFSRQSFETWREDLGAVLAHARVGAKGRVIVLGLRLGALLGLKAFDAGLADALLAWDPPVDARTMLMDMLRRKLAADYMEFGGGERKSREDYVKELERGVDVEVEGYPWGRELWRTAERFAFGPPERLGGEWHAVWLDGRGPEKLPNPDHQASVRIPRPAFWLQSSVLVPDVSALFAHSVERLDSWLAAWTLATPGAAS